MPSLILSCLLLTSGQTELRETGRRAVGRMRGQSTVGAGGALGKRRAELRVQSAPDPFEDYSFCLTLPGVYSPDTDLYTIYPNRRVLNFLHIYNIFMGCR